MLDVHSLDSKTMRDELPCEIYACECLPITFFRGKRPPGAVWALALRRGYITISFGSILGHDLRGLRLFLTPSTTRDLGLGTDHFYQLDSASTRSDYA